MPIAILGQYVFEWIGDAQAKVLIRIRNSVLRIHNRGDARVALDPTGLTHRGTRENGHIDSQRRQRGNDCPKPVKTGLNQLDIFNSRTRANERTTDTSSCALSTLIGSRQG